MWEKSGLIFLLPVAGYVLYFAKLVLCVSLLLLPNLFQYKLQTFPIAAAVLHFLITVLCYLLPFFLMGKIVAALFYQFCFGFKASQIFSNFKIIR